MAPMNFNHKAAAIAVFAIAILIILAFGFKRPLMVHINYPTHHMDNCHTIMPDQIICD